jgi:hypothetical protein
MSKPLAEHTSEQLLKATIEYHKQELNDLSMVRSLELALKLMQPDGWQFISPAWLRIQENLSLTEADIPSLVSTSPEQRLVATIRHARLAGRTEEVKGLQLALKLLAPNGWEFVAPHWLNIQPIVKTSGVKRPNNNTTSSVAPKPSKNPLPNMETLTPAERIHCALGDHDTRAKYEFADGLKYALKFLANDRSKNIAPNWTPTPPSELTPAQSVEALIASGLPLPAEFKFGLRYAIKLLQPNGWELLVPVWWTQANRR